MGVYYTPSKRVHIVEQGKKQKHWIADVIMVA